MANCSGTRIRAGCVECDIPQLARNNYFTGKLLVERDFTDEQRYFIGKQRRHNQRLHGWGTVCGLKVREHPNPECQKQYVLIEPGMAIDCCGREILVAHEEYFDFKTRLLDNWEKQFGPGTQPPSTQPLYLRFCVRYRECPTEDVPALFDDCSCSDSECRPNRILESHEFDVLIGPPPVPDDPLSAQLELVDTINIGNPVAVAINNGVKYVLTSDATKATVYTVNSVNKTVDSQSFPSFQGLDVAVSADGSRVYVALKGTSGDPQIQVLDSQNLSTTISTLTVTKAATDKVRLAVAPAPDGRLFAVSPSAGVLVWGTDVNSNKNPKSPTPVTAGTNPVAIATSANFAYVANSGSANVSAITLAIGSASDLKVTNINVPVSGATSTPASISVATTTGGDNIAVIDQTAQTLYLVGLRPDTSNPADLGAPVTGFAHNPIDVVLSQSGGWAYVLEQDSKDQTGYIQAVDVNKVSLKQPNVIGSAVAVGVNPQRITISSDGRRLYVAYDGDGKKDSGAVSIVDVLEQDCLDLISRTIEGCPDCTENCIILATVVNYNVDDLVTDDRIDNLVDRHILPSTDVLTEVVECILEHGVGGGGTGSQGPPGPGIDAVQATFVDCSVAGQAQIQTLSGQRTLVLQIPKGCDGLNGAPGAGIDDVKINFVPCDQFVPAPQIVMVGGKRILELTIPSSCNTALTHIVGINWPHAGSMSLSDFQKNGLLVAFDGPVQPTDINSQSFAVLLSHRDQESQTVCWCELPGRLQAGNFTTVGLVTSGFTPGLDNHGLVNGLRFWTDIRPTGTSGVVLRIVLKGDYIRGATNNGRAVDADHLPPWLGSGATRTGDGIEGGTFESWFTLTP